MNNIEQTANQNSLELKKEIPININENNADFITHKKEIFSYYKNSIFLLV